VLAGILYVLYEDKDRCPRSEYFIDKNLVKIIKTIMLLKCTKITVRINTNKSMILNILSSDLEPLSRPAFADMFQLT